MIQFKEQNSKWQILLDGEEVLTIPVPEGCHDSFELIQDNVGVGSASYRRHENACYGLCFGGKTLE